MSQRLAVVLDLSGRYVPDVNGTRYVAGGSPFAFGSSSHEYRLAPLAKCHNRSINQTETLPKIPAANKPQVVETFGKLPLYFIENQGQFDPGVAYYIQGGDKSIYFTGRGVTFAPTERPGSPSLGGPRGAGSKICNQLCKVA